MNVTQMPILEALGTPNARFVIPMFQRVYSWTARQCDELWDDVLRASQTESPHFMGMLLCSPDADSWHGLEQLNVIDGQQRLTTLTLLLTALHRHLSDAPQDGLPSCIELEYTFLLAGADDALGAKLVLSGNDNATLAALVGAAQPPEAPAQRLIDNYRLFADKMSEAEFDATALWKGLMLLEVAAIKLDATDNPQLVFESLNSKGMPLSIADRVRNLIVASNAGSNQDRLFETMWMPLEQRVSKVEPSITTSDILHAWLVRRYRSVRIIDATETYGVLKTCLRDEYNGSLEPLLVDVSAYLERFLNDPKLREQDQRAAQEWIAGKPESSVSEFKLFGD